MDLHITHGQVSVPAGGPFDVTFLVGQEEALQSQASCSQTLALIRSPQPTCQLTPLLTSQCTE